MTNAAAFDCWCAGIVVADHVCQPIARLPRGGELVLTDRTELAIGGCAANVAIGLARLGHSAAIVGRVGDDYLGRFVADGLKQAKVDVRHLATVPGEATSCSIVVNVRGEGRRFIHARGANRTLTGAEITSDMLQRTRVMYLGGYCLSEQPSPANIAALFRRAREAGVTTVLDVVLPEAGDYWPFLEPVLPWTDVFLPNNDEGEAITGRKEPLAQALRFRDAGAKTVIITCGDRGSVAACPEGTFRAGRFPIAQVDPTGGGDAFAAGFIHGLLRGAGAGAGADVETCVRMGSALGASCVRSAGATTATFNARELDQFLNSQPFEWTRV